MGSPAKPVMGRPPREPKAGAATRQISIRLTEHEHKAWTRAADAAEAPSLVDWIRNLGNRAARRES